MPRGGSRRSWRLSLVTALASDQPEALQEDGGLDALRVKCDTRAFDCASPTTLTCPAGLHGPISDIRRRQRWAKVVEQMHGFGLQFPAT